MDKTFKTINIILVIADTIIAALAIAGFGAAAYVFSKWWITLFALFPLTLFYSHGIIVDTEVKQEEEGGDKDP